jgi:hypothetical protein
MKVREMNNRVLIKRYNESTDPELSEILKLEIIGRGFTIDTDNTIYFFKCDRNKKWITCALCTNSPWCMEYESGGFGRGH